MPRLDSDQPSASAQGGATAGQTGQLAMGAVTSADPSYTNGQSSPLSLTPAGTLRVSPQSAAGTDFAIDASGNALTRVVTSPLGGHTMGRIISAASTNPTLVKGSAGVLYGISAYNVGAAVVFLKFYNKATLPTVGTDTPVWTVAIGPSQQVNVDFVQGLAFSAGIGFGITNLVADNDATIIAANQVTGMVAYN